MNTIYAYTDCQQFLQEYYEEMKQSKYQFSYQFLADRCGFKSKTYLHKVITGKKPLSIDGALKIGAYMKLSDREMKYFQSIVHFTNAKTVDEKEYYFKELQEFSKHEPVSHLRENQFLYFHNWYNSVIRELVAIIDWQGDYKILASYVNPRISAAEARRSVQLLRDLELIRQREDGSYERTEKVITTGADIVSLAVHNFQKENLQLASQSIDRFPRPDRSISTLTVSVSQEGKDAVFQELALCRKRLISLVRADRNVDRVYQLNFQAFPLSNHPKETK